MIKYIFLLFFSIFLLSACGDKLSTSTTDDSANITNALLTGTWTAKCSDNTTASTSSKTVLVFYASGDNLNLNATTTNYSNLSCVTQSSDFTKKLKTLELGSNKTYTSQNQIIKQFTAVVTDITLEPKTSPGIISLNISSFCGLTGWGSGETSVAGLTCGSITYNAVNDTHSDIIQMNSEKTFIRLGNITNAASTGSSIGYPKTLYAEEYYK